MFGFTHPGTASSVDPEKERFAPPAPTLVYFPQNDVELQADRSWLPHPPDLFKEFSHLAKPLDVNISHLKSLNLTLENDVPLEDLIPRADDGLHHLPSHTWDTTPEPYDQQKHPLLSNGSKAPERDTYVKFVKELGVDTQDGLRSIGKRKPRPGHPPPNFNQFRRFWSALELVSQYWDTSLDHYYEAGDSPKQASAKAHPTALKRLSLSIAHRDSGVEAHKGRYTGWRTSNGAKMPDQYRIDCVRAFMEPIAWAFGCQMANPRRVPLLQIKQLLIPCTQTAIIWRSPQDKNLAKRGILEGPVLGIQARGETNFVQHERVGVVDIAREVSGLVLLAQERAREGKSDIIPGANKWYTTKPRWGGGPGGEFGDAEAHRNDKPTVGTASRRHSLTASTARPKGPSEEDIWKELKPGPGLFEPRISYLAVGRERGADNDSVFMVSCLYHHISILRLSVHPLYIEYLITGHLPSGLPNAPWHSPNIQRSRWFDLLVAADRVEALRGIWGVLSYSMRSGQHHGETASVLGLRQKSEIHHGFHFRKKSSHFTEVESTPRSFSHA